MANLINNAEQLKANFSGMDANFSWPSIKSFVEDVEEDIISDTIGSECLNYFISNINTVEVNAAKCLKLLQRACAYLAILKWSQTALFRFTDKALYVAKSSDGVIISDKKLRDLRNYCEENGFNYLDKALALLESNLDDFPVYRDSLFRHGRLEAFIHTAADFSLQRNIGKSRLTFLSVHSIMLDIQEKIFPAVLGASYYEEFKERFMDGDLTAAEKKILPLIKKALAYLTIAEAGKDLPLKITERGIFINRYNNTSDYDQADPASAARTQYLSDDHLEKGERKLIDLQNHLVKNVADLTGYILPVLSIENVNDCESGLFLM